MKLRFAFLIGLFAVPLLASPVLAEEPVPTPAGDGLDDVAGIERFRGDAGARALLAKNGFVVLPRYHEQIFQPYIGGGLPPYVTVDSIHSTYHVLYETALGELDDALAAALRDDAAALATRLAADLAAGGPKELEAARRLAAGWAAVGARLAGAASPELPADLSALVERDVAAVQAAQGRGDSALFGVAEDWGAFRPRGTYAGRPEREAYFRAVTWFGRRGFRVVSETETAAAILVVRAVDADAAFAKRHTANAELLSWLVGPPDDLTVDEYRAAARAVLGDGLAPDALVARMAALRARLAALRAPEINASMLPPAKWQAFREETKGMRLLPSRRTADAWLFQQLTETFPGRGLPSGLDVALALGGDRAGAHLAADGADGAAVAERVRELAPGFRERLEGTHYGATLSALGGLFDRSGPLRGAGAKAPPAGGAPTDGDLPLLPASLFSGDAWGDRLLVSGLGGWASLRHAWLLHAKTAASYLGATTDLPGVVEPAPRFYEALARLSRELLDRARAAGVFTRGDPKETGRELLAVLRLAQEMRSSGRRPTADEMERMRAHMSVLERLLARAGDPEKAIARLEKMLAAWLDGTGELGEAEREALAKGGASKTEENLVEVAGLCDRLAAIARKEIAGDDLDPADLALVTGYGKTIARLAFFEGNSWLQPGVQRGLVADVFSAPASGEVLSVGVGAAAELYLVLPLRKGGRALYRGGVTTYYETASPERLTDAEWVRRIEARRTPPMPAWTSSFVAKVDAAPLVARIRAGEIVRDVGQLRDPRVGAALLAVVTGEVAAKESGAWAADRHRAWAAEALALYGDGELRPRVFDALLDAAMRAPLQVVEAGSRGTATFHRSAAGALRGVVGPQDRDRLKALLTATPEGVEPARARSLAAGLLAWSSVPAEIESEFTALLESDDAGLRKEAISILAGYFSEQARLQMAMVDSSRETPTEAACRRVQARVLVQARDDADAGNRLHALRTLDRMGTALDPARDGAVLWEIIDAESTDAPTRAQAVALAVGLRRSEDAPKLLALVDGDDERTRAAAAKAVGVAAAAGDDALRGKVRDRLVAQVLEEGHRQWPVSVGALEGIARLGDEASADALLELAWSEKVEDRLRHIALRHILDGGEAALPALFRLTFDETETNTSYGRKLRRCDQAAARIDVVLGDEFGFSESLSLEDADRILVKIRAEAKRRGHEPLPPQPPGLPR